MGPSDIVLAVAGNKSGRARRQALFAKQSDCNDIITVAMCA